jgi:hypothetical protein
MAASLPDEDGILSSYFSVYLYEDTPFVKERKL